MPAKLSRGTIALRNPSRALRARLDYRTILTPSLNGINERQMPCHQCYFTGVSIAAAVAAL